MAADKWEIIGVVGSLASILSITINFIQYYRAEAAKKGFKAISNSVFGSLRKIEDMASEARTVPTPDIDKILSGIENIARESKNYLGQFYKGVLGK